MEWWLFANAVFGALLRVRYTFQQIAEVTVQRLANQVKVFQIDSRREIVVILVDRGRTDTGGTR